MVKNLRVKITTELLTPNCCFIKLLLPVIYMSAVKCCFGLEVCKAYLV